jgi:protein gp37
MGKDSKIEWTHHTFNPWTGCTKVSPGCTHCYAEAWARRTGVVKWGPDGERRRTSESSWRQPAKWNREAIEAGLRRRVFCASLADVFEDRPELDAWRRDLARLIWETPHLDWLLLTKRPENARQMTYEMWFPDAAWPGNYWVGCTVENQEYADRRIPELLKVPASVRFLSVEPLLGPVDLSPYLARRAGIDLVIVGGESGPGARPMHPRWARTIRDQCRAAGVPHHFKQWGEWAPVGDDTPRGVRLAYVHERGGSTPAISGYEPGCPCDSMMSDDPMVRVGKARAGRELDGRTWDELPEGATP